MHQHQQIEGSVQYAYVYAPSASRAVSHVVFEAILLAFSLSLLLLETCCIYSYRTWSFLTSERRADEALVPWDAIALSTALLTLRLTMLLFNAMVVCEEKILFKRIAERER